MSQRGSFTSEFIYCDACATILRTCLSEIDSVAMHDGGGHIVSGFIGGGSPGDEGHKVERAMSEVATLFCHKVRVVVLPEESRAVHLSIEESLIAPLEHPSRFLVVKPVW